MLSTLPGFKVCKVNRLGNVAAHSLAAFGYREWSSGVLLNSVPPCVVGSIQSDCNPACNTAILFD